MYLSACFAAPVSLSRVSRKGSLCQESSLNPERGFFCALTPLQLLEEHLYRRSQHPGCLFFTTLGGPYRAHTFRSSSHNHVLFSSTFCYIKLQRGWAKGSRLILTLQLRLAVAYVQDYGVWSDLLDDYYGNRASVDRAASPCAALPSWTKFGCHPRSTQRP